MTQPFLKWPGGKRWLSSHVAALITQEPFGRYYEPFLGGGAVFFALKPEQAILSDINPALIETYEQVRKDPTAIAERLSEIPIDSTTYYRMRSERRGSALDRAIRFLYLNRTAFGGLYRENMRGEFNVPFGGGDRTPELLWRTPILTEASEALHSAKLLSGDFEEIVSKAQQGDVVYCDPTYNTPSKQGPFRRYNGTRFTWEDQERLASVAFQASERGALVLVSNDDSYDIRKLYTSVKRFQFERASCLSAKSAGRRKIRETLYVLPPKGSSQSVFTYAA